MALPKTLEVVERDHLAYDINVAQWRDKDKPHGISGLFRLKNESEFMRWAIESHMEWLDEAVLVVQDSEDATIEIAHELTDIYGERIKVWHYPFEVTQYATPRHFSVPTNSVEHFVHLTNWGLSKCNYSWIAKIEGDVIAMPTFQVIRDIIDLDPDTPKYYGRVGFNIAGQEMDQFSYTNPRNAGWDEAVFPNDPKFHCIRDDKWESLNMRDYRHLLHNMGWSFIHVKRCKQGAVIGSERWEGLTEDNIRASIAGYNMTSPHPGPDDPVSDELLDWIINNAITRSRTHVGDFRSRGKSGGSA